MMQGAKDLLGSERGAFAVLLVVAVTALCIAGKLTGSDWLAYTKWIAVALIAGKTVEKFAKSEAVPV